MGANVGHAVGYRVGCQARAVLEGLETDVSEMAVLLDDRHQSRCHEGSVLNGGQSRRQRHGAKAEVSREGFLPDGGHGIAVHRLGNVQMTALASVARDLGGAVGKETVAVQGVGVVLVDPLGVQGGILVEGSGKIILLGEYPGVALIIVPIVKNQLLPLGHGHFL